MIAPYNTWNYPNSLRIGIGRAHELAHACRELGIRRPLLITDRVLSVTDMVRRALDDCRREFGHCGSFDDVKSNPTGCNVADGLAAYRAGDHDGVIGFGGGSVLDTAKAVALMVGQDRPLWDFEDVGDNQRRVRSDGIAPMIALPTTASSGSEAGRAAVITDEATRVKRTMLHLKMMPCIAFLDADLTAGMPASLTAATGADALPHCMEAWCSPVYHPMAGAIAMEGLRLIRQALPAVVADGQDLAMRQQMLVASAMGAVAFQRELGGVHAIAQTLGALYGHHHGLLNAIVLPYVLRANAAALDEPMTQLARYLDLARPGFAAVLDWVLDLRERIGIPHTLAALGINDRNAELIGRTALTDGCSQPTRCDIVRLPTRRSSAKRLQASDGCRSRTHASAARHARRRYASARDRRTHCRCVLLLAHDGAVVHAGVAGWANREKAQPMQCDTVFRFASLTKLVTSVTALRLCELGWFDLGTPITRWLPYFRPLLADGSVPVITSRHLLSHVAGLSYGFEMPPGNAYEIAGISDGLDACKFGIEENLRRLEAIPLQSAPGSAWQYSMATDVLGAVLECAAGDELPALVARYVTNLLGMAATHFGAPVGRMLATPYRDAIGGGEPSLIGADDWLVFDTSRIRVSADRAHSLDAWPSGGAGLVGTADDYLRLLECLRTGDAPVLGAATTQRLLDNALRSVTIRSRDPGWGFGLGPLVLTDPARGGSPQHAGTWGWCGLFGAHYWVNPVMCLSMVAMTNTGVAGAWGSFATSIVAALYDPQMI